MYIYIYIQHAHTHTHMLAHTQKRTHTHTCKHAHTCSHIRLQAKATEVYTIPTRLSTQLERTQNDMHCFKRATKCLKEKDYLISSLNTPSFTYHYQNWLSDSRMKARFFRYITMTLSGLPVPYLSNTSPTFLIKMCFVLFILNYLLFSEALCYQAAR